LIDVESNWPRYFAGIFYMINPYTYERWMAGQYLVLAGYALLPFLVKSLIDFYVSPTKNKSIKLAIWYTAIVLLSIHIFVMAILVGVVMLVTNSRRKKKGVDYARHLRRSIGTIISGFLIINFYWLIKVLDGSSSINQTVNNIGPHDLAAFATASNPHTGLFFNVISMYGFWLERYKRYAMPNHILAIWIIGFLLIATLIVVGAKTLIKDRSQVGLALAICAVIGLIMSLGPNAAVTGDLVRWIILHVPLMKGFREPEKFSALLVLAYVYFAAYGLDTLIKRLPAKAEARRELLRDGALILPVLYVSTMPFGFANQLKPVQYPAAWYAYENQLLAHPITGKILFLPWHEYMSYDFTPRIIANPAPDFFYNAPVISGTNAQFGGLNDPDPTPTSLFIENQVLSSTNQTDLGKKLAVLHIHYVLLANGYDVNKYGWLNHQKDLKLISREPGLAVYKNEAYNG
jgi:NADH:ubiquinone oxidoreductase subunit 6 (subunit J)